jgi:phenylpropionate dioxygenase-like ring-hydroxylating dioxygenase large terminal subunit
VVLSTLTNYIRSNWVFVNLDPTTSVSLREYLGPLVKITEKYNLETYKYFREVIHEVDINWKTYVDNYQEGYHVPVAHPALDKVVDCRYYKVDVWNHPMGGGHAIHSVPPRKGKHVKDPEGDSSLSQSKNNFQLPSNHLIFAYPHARSMFVELMLNFSLSASLRISSKLLVGSRVRPNLINPLVRYSELIMTYTRQGGQQWSMGLSLS